MRHMTASESSLKMLKAGNVHGNVMTQSHRLTPSRLCELVVSLHLNIETVSTGDMRNSLAELRDHMLNRYVKGSDFLTGLQLNK